ncbi:MAG: hypothetical protein OEM94_08465 [Acidimicrobiia bacterium]|nr:hypothetical protein [Acidimicrobiia bacterium]
MVLRVDDDAILILNQPDIAGAKATKLKKSMRAPPERNGPAIGAHDALRSAARR